MKIVKVFYDLETTGVNPKRNSIHQLAGMVEVDGGIVETFNLKLAPHPNAEIEAEAMEVGGVSAELIKSYPPYQEGYMQFKSTMAKYINPYDRTEKAWLVGYNNRAFDDLFLRKLFELCGDIYIGSWFWADTIDVLCLASEYLIERRSGMRAFKQGVVAEELGIEVDPEKLHDAVYDVEITRNIYRIVTGKDCEI